MLPGEASKTSLNGFWERGRRLLRLFGQPWDPNVVPVMIVADSRECGGMPDTYRRFSLTSSNTIAINSCIKIRCTNPNGATITRIRCGYDTPAARSGAIRTMTAAEGVLGATTWVALAAGPFSGAFVDTPGSGAPPFQTAADGQFDAGLLAAHLPRASTNGPGDMDLFLPFNAGINIQASGTAFTNSNWQIEGYLR